MNSADTAIIGICFIGAFAGWKAGFIRRSFGWIAAAIGVLLISLVLPYIFPVPEVPEPSDLFKRLAFLVAGAALGQSLGRLAGSKVRTLEALSKFREIDALAGAVTGVLWGIAIVWISLPSVLAMPGGPANLVRDSTLAPKITQLLGQPPKFFDGVSKSLGVEGLESALINIQNSGETPVAPTNQPVPPDILAIAQQSVVRLAGEACGLTQSGSGFVIAPGLIATNAHVVAGTEVTRITNDEGLDLVGRVHYLDTNNDIALVASPGLTLVPLALRDVERADVGSIVGYPSGGALDIQPFTVAAVTTAESQDIYDQVEFSRSVVILGTRIGPGDSGGPLIGVTGKVLGIAFGISPTDAETAYAIPSQLLSDVLSESNATPISSGACRK